MEPLQSKVRRQQMKLLGHILRRPYLHPNRLSIFEPNTNLENRKIEPGYPPGWTPPDCVGGYHFAEYPEIAEDSSGPAP